MSPPSQGNFRTNFRKTSCGLDVHLHQFWWWFLTKKTSKIKTVTHKTKQNLGDLATAAMQTEVVCKFDNVCHISPTSAGPHPLPCTSLTVPNCILILRLRACWLRRLSETAAVASFALGEVFRHWPPLDVAPPCFHWEWFLSVQLTPHSQHLGAEGAPHVKKLPHSKGSGAGVQGSQLWQQKDTLLSLQLHMQTLNTRSREYWN